MALKTKLIGFFLISLISAVYAQTDSIEAEEPYGQIQTEYTPYTVQKKHIQIENDFSYESYGEGASAFSHPVMLLKYGLTDRFELRVQAEPFSEKTGGNISSTSTLFAPTNIGFKANILKEKNWYTPEIGVKFYYGIPALGSSSLKPEYAQLGYQFLMQHNFTDRVSVTYAIGQDWSGYEKGAELNYLFNFSYASSAKTWVYFEGYGNYIKNIPSSYSANLGLMYYIKDNFVFDTYVGTGLHNSGIKFDIGTIVSYAFGL
jgi:hypothetical protein